MKIIIIKIFISLLILFGSQSVSAQYNILDRAEDTLNYNYRVLTERLDSIPFLQSGYTTLQPGGNFISPLGELQDGYARFFSVFQNFSPSFSPLKNIYSGIPHLGFYYSFGSRGLQNVHVDYQQTFAKKFNINLNYSGNHLNKDAGFLRNSGYTNNVIQLLMNYNGKRYKGLYFFDYYFGQRRSSDGLLDSANVMLSQNPLQLIPVRNETAFSKLNNFDGGTQHLFSITKDSVVEQGFVYQNKISVNSRKYTESAATLLNYSAIYNDSTQTYDNAQTSILQNEFGYFIKTSHFSIDAMGYHRYWYYKNYGYLRKFSEIGISGNILLNWKKLQFGSHLEFAFVGLPGEMTSNSTLNWSITQLLKFNAYLNIHNYYPSLFMTKYSGNTIQWDNTHNFKLQQTIKSGGELAWNLKIPVKAGIDFVSLSNHYWLINGQMRNDTLSQATLFSAHIKSDLKAGHFHFDPYLAVNVTSKEMKFLPLADARLSVYWNKKLFSTKKFDFILGATVRYQTKYDLIAYNYLVDLYQIQAQNSSMSYSPIVRVDFFTGFQIDNFRFFIRYENLDSFWNSPVNFSFINYPISQGIIRIGLTWDFFN